MEKDWVKVYSSQLIHKVEHAKALLEDSGIKSIFMNNQESIFPTLNANMRVELFVKNLDVIRAKHIINKNEL